LKSKKTKKPIIAKSGVQSLAIYDRICKIIENARGNIVRAINTEMVIAYWHIGREIVEEE